MFHVACCSRVKMDAWIYFTEIMGDENLSSEKKAAMSRALLATCDPAMPSATTPWRPAPLSRPQRSLEREKTGPPGPGGSMGVPRVCWGRWEQVHPGHLLCGGATEAVVRLLGHCYRVDGRGFVQQGRAGLGESSVSFAGETRSRFFCWGLGRRSSLRWRSVS